MAAQEPEPTNQYQSRFSGTQAGRASMSALAARVAPIINRVLVYGSLTITIVGIYFLIVTYLGTLVQPQNHLVISLVATGIIAVLFQPLRTRLQQIVNRLMHGKRDEPYQVLSRLGQRLEATIAPEAVLPTIVETVALALKLPYAAITLKHDDDMEIVAEYGDRPNPTETPHSLRLISLPLVYQHDLVGQLLFPLPDPNMPFSTADRRLLEDLARQAGVAVHTVQLHRDLQRSRERLVTAREEERRRIRGALHDGIGPELTNHTLTIEAARDLVYTQPEQASTMIEGLLERSQSILSEIRRIVYALRPPALDELGLVSAIREQIAQYTPSGLRIELIAPEPLPALPAAVEVAAYRILQESLTNVIKHSQARTCVVRLSLVGDAAHRTLGLEISDDGIGLPEGHHTGAGLNAMRERAEELGGVCLVAAGTDGGTYISAFLPLA